MTIIPFSTREGDDYARLWIEQLQKDLPDLQIAQIDQLSDAECASVTCAIVANPDLEELARLPNLEWIQSVWAGIEGLAKTLPIDGPKIVRLKDPTLSDTMAEAVLAWSLYLNRNMPHYTKAQNQRQWLPIESRLANETNICMLGLGALGETAAQRLKMNGFKVSGWSRTEKSIEGIETFHGPEGWREAVADADIMVCLMPLTPQTKQFFNESFFAATQPGAHFINFARGALVDDQALLNALDQGQIAHAVLDVFATEPLPESHVFWRHESVTVLPHISGPTHRPTASQTAAKNIRQFLSDGTIPAHVDRKFGY